MPKVKAIDQLRDATLFWAFAGLTILSSLAAVLLYEPLPLVVPALILAALFALNSVRQLYYVFFLLLPFSIEFQIGSFGTDLPSEPMMIGLMGLGLLLLVKKLPSLDARLYTHPVAIIIYLHLSWIALTALTSTYPIVSLKYLLAKCWYVYPFFFMPLLLFREERQYRRIFQFLTVSMFVAITYVLVRHAGSGFSFAQSNKVLRPIFRNHVNYALMLIAFLPYYWHLLRTSLREYRVIGWGLLAFLLLAIYFSYTRAAQMSVILVVVYYWVVRLRQTVLCVGLALAMMVGLSAFLTYDAKYLEYAPNYENTIAHKKFDNLVEATAKMEDISTVERFYRWVAGGYMIQEKPLMGFGPATFYNNYTSYTVTSYMTYVSDNPEKSGIHNNYLMVAVEQGLVGLLIMLAMAILPLVYAERTYHLLTDVYEKGLVMAAAMSYFVIDVTILINDMLEADKVGPIYFLSAAIIVWYSVQVRRGKNG
jgi:O-antigen ligase